MQTLTKPSVATKIAKTETKAKIAWLEERKTYIGATDAAAICGVNPYQSPHDVWLAKKGLVKDESNIAMRHGTYIETFIAQEFQAKSGHKVYKSKTYRHKDHPWAACNPDRELRINGEFGLLECKSVGFWASKNFGQDGADQIPEHYAIQIMWQLIVTGAKFVILAALVDNRELRTFTYTLDPALSANAHVFPPELVQSVLRRCKKFWEQNVTADVEPLMTGHDSDTEWIQQERATYENGQLTNTDEATDEYCTRLEKAARRKKRAEYVEAELKNRIKRFMAEQGASELESSVGIFTFRTNIKGTAMFKTPFTSNRA